MGEGILLGLGAACCFAATDVSAALAARFLSSAKIIFVAQGSAFMVLLACGWSSWQPLMADTVLLSLILGVVSAISVRAMYRALEHGPLAMVSPVLSCSSAITALLAALVLHEPVVGSALCALCLIFGGVVAVTTPARVLLQLRLRVPSRSLAPGFVFAVIAMLSLGLGNFVLGLPALSWEAWIISRLWTLGFLLVWERVAPIVSLQMPGPERHGWRRGAAWVGAGISGGSEIGGLFCYRAASQLLPLAVSALIVSLYSVIPVCIGILYLRERPTVLQIVGLVAIGGGESC